MKAHLTEAYIKALPPEDKFYIVWDTNTKRFGVRVTPKGKKTYVVQTEVKGRTRRKTIRKTIGTVGDISLKRAQELGSVVLLDMRGGTDILSRMVEEKRARDAETKMTVADLVKEFMAKYVERHCKPGTVHQYRLNLEKYFLPKFRNYKINEVTKKDIRELHGNLSDKPHTANQVLASVSKMYNEAKKWELCDGLVNPCEGIKKFPEKQRELYLSYEELQCLHRALNDEEAAAPMAVAAFRLLLYTGARRGEIQTLKWDYINDDLQAHLPDSKTGPRTLFLSPKAKEILDAIPRVNGNDYVITSKEPGAFLVNLKDPWERVRQRATVYFLRDYCTDDLAQLVNNLCAYLGQLPDLAQCRKMAEKLGLEVPEGLSNLRIHDLRHNFASQLTMRGVDLPDIAALLGNKTIQTATRYAYLSPYANLDDSAVVELMKKVGGLFDVKGVSNNSGGDDVPIFEPEPHDDPEKYEPVYDMQS